jgi:hypothetical protein
MNSETFKDKSIAIIGNGGSLCDSNSGEEIDSYDIVIRFNNFNTSGSYQKDVGSKTSYWCNTFCADIKPREDELSILCPLPVNAPNWRKIYSSTSVEMIRRYIDKTSFIPEKIFQGLWDQMPINKSRHRKDPSTGLCMIYWLRALKYNITINDIFGFDFFSKDTSHHYFDRAPSPSVDHDGDMERTIIKNITIN